MMHHGIVAHSLAVWAWLLVGIAIVAFIVGGRSETRGDQ